MDITSLVEIGIVVIVIYFFIKFIVSPIARLILGIIIVLVTIYLLQRFFGFDTAKIFGPFAKYLDINNLGVNLNWILGPTNYYIDQIKNFLNLIWSNFPKSPN